MPGQAGRGLRAQILQGLFVGEGCLFILDLVGGSVHFDVACFGEGDMILDPGLSEVLGDELLEDFASVVLGGGEEVIEVGFGADREGLAGLEQFFLLLGGLEAERAPSATACVIQRAHEGEQVGGRHGAPHGASAHEPEHIVVGIGKAVITVDDGLEDDGVH